MTTFFYFDRKEYLAECFKLKSDNDGEIVTYVHEHIKKSSMEHDVLIAKICVNCPQIRELYINYYFILLLWKTLIKKKKINYIYRTPRHFLSERKENQVVVN